MPFDIVLEFHFPHDIFTLGWECMPANDEYDYTTVRIFLLIVTITINR